MDIAERLQRELDETRARLRHDANLALVDDGTVAVADPHAIVDEVDGAQQSIEREMTLATRSRLRERAHRLIEALERIREGLYGICEECENAIAPARLAALPEVTTCVACQQRREAAARHGDVEPTDRLDDDDDTD
jgi:DnaK suppressor protein